MHKYYYTLLSARIAKQKQLTLLRRLRLRRVHHIEKTTDESSGFCEVVEMAVLKPRPKKKMRRVYIVYLFSDV